MNGADGTTRGSAPSNQAGAEGPDGPDAPDPTENLPAPSEVSTDLRATFWTLVFLIKVTIIATTLGLLFVVFEDNWNLGGPILGLGVLCFLFAVVRYRRFRRSEAEEASSEASG